MVKHHVTSFKPNLEAYGVEEILSYLCGLPSGTVIEWTTANIHESFPFMTGGADIWMVKQHSTLGWDWEISLTTNEYLMEGTSFNIEPDVVVNVETKEVIETAPETWKNVVPAASMKRINEGIKEWVSICSGRTDLQFVYVPFSFSSEGITAEEKAEERLYTIDDAYAMLFEQDYFKETELSSDSIVARRERSIQKMQEMFQG